MAYSERLDEALVFAHQLHRAQTRKGTDIPYITHLMGVASLAGEHGASEDEVIASLLHDAVEDQSADYPGGRPALEAAIRERFGERVLEVVLACTDGDEAEARHAGNWRARKEAYVAAIADKDPGVRLVACADKLHNARAILSDLRRHGGALWGRFNAERDELLWYYSELAQRFVAAADRDLPDSGTRGLARELGVTVNALLDTVHG